MRTALFIALSAVIAHAAAQTPQSSPAHPSAQGAQPSTSSTEERPAQFNRVDVELAPTEGNRAKGELTLSPDNHGLRITGTISGLKANSQHGFHIHQNGDCSAPDASSAGDHFNPEEVPHGNPASQPHHAGDMPNIEADGQGNADVDLRIMGVTLGDGGEHDIIGRAAIVHADPDDYSSQPSGNAGARIACGVIEPPPPPPAADAEKDAEDENGNGSE